MTNEGGDSWLDLWSRVETLVAGLGRSRAVNVNARNLREMAGQVAQLYFRSVRPELEELRTSLDMLQLLDAPVQRLLTLSNGQNAKSLYRRAIRDMRRARAQVEPFRELSIGRAQEEALFAHSSLERAIARTLQQLVPTAAMSYEQALADLRDRGRRSFRGTSSELRESLREVLDHLAPDAKVMGSADFKLEKGLTKPTMKQKVRFILRSRGMASGAIASPEAAVQRVEAATGALARSVYDRGSLATHVSATRDEVVQLKHYLEGVLAEILQIYSSRR